MILRVGQRKMKNPSLSVLFVKSYWYSFSHSTTFNDRNLLLLYLVAYCVAKQKISHIITEKLFFEIEWILWMQFFFLRDLSSASWFKPNSIFYHLLNLVVLYHVMLSHYPLFSSLIPPCCFQHRCSLHFHHLTFPVISILCEVTQ
jgi:hypothetical protein